MYCPNDVERVRREAAIEDIVSETVKLSPRGTDLWGKCPFHDDPVPSFKVSPKWGTWRCWNCGGEGDAIDFVMLRDGVERQEAIRLLADRAGIKLREKAPVTNDLSSGCEPIGKVASEMAQRFVQRDLGSPSELLETGYRRIDCLLGRLRPGEMIAVGSRPGIGKTSFAVSLTRSLAYQGAAVVFFALGMKREEIVARLLSAQSGVDSDRLLRDEVLGRDLDLVVSEAENLAALDVVVDDTPDLKIEEIRDRVSKVLAGKKRGVIVIDCLQLVSPTQRRPYRSDEMDDVSRQVKRMAMELNVTVVALSQLERDCLRRCDGSDPCPQLSGPRESGSIEQDADVVILLDRSMSEEEAKREERPDMGIVRFIVDKNRFGETGEAELVFTPGNTRFWEVLECEKVGPS